MFRYFRALDPGRSLATAFAWFAVALSLTIALALVAVGDYAANSMLAQRDALVADHLPLESGISLHTPVQIHILFRRSTGRRLDRGSAADRWR